MTAVVINDRDKALVLRAIAAGRQRALRECSDFVDQMIAQLHDVKAQFHREIAALRQQLADSQRQLRVLQAIDELSRCPAPDVTRH